MDLKPTSASDPTNYRIVIAGFAVGIVGGLFFLGGRSAPEKDPAERRIVENSTQSTEPADKDDNQSLMDERERLESELESLKFRKELAALRREVDQLRTSEVSTPAPHDDSATSRHSSGKSAIWTVRESGGEPSPQTPTKSLQSADASGLATLAYWNRMNDIIEREAAMRVAPGSGLSALNAGGFLRARIRAAEYAVDALRSMETSNVDSRATTLAESLAEWYEQGGEVAKTGHNLLTRGSNVQREGTAGQQYQAAEKSHAAAVDIVNAQGEQVRQQLTTDYTTKFPPLK